VDIITKILGLLGISLDASSPALTFVQRVTDFFGALPVALRLAVGFLEETRAEFSEGETKAEDVLGEAATLSELVTKVLGVLSLNDAFAKLTTGEALKEGQFRIPLKEAVEGLISSLKEGLEILMPGLQEIQTTWGAALELVEGLSGRISGVFKGVADIAKSSQDLSESGGINLSAIRDAQQDMAEIQFGMGGGESIAQAVGAAVKEAIASTGFTIRVRDESGGYKTISARLAELTQIVIDLGTGATAAGAY